MISVILEALLLKQWANQFLSINKKNSLLELIDPLRSLTKFQRFKKKRNEGARRPEINGVIFVNQEGVLISQWGTDILRFIRFPDISEYERTN